MSIKELIKNTSIFKNYRKRQIETNLNHFLSKTYKKVVGRELNLENPQTYTEKIQWKKIFDHNPLYTKCADKISVRDYVAEKLDTTTQDETFFTHWYGIWDKADDIDWDSLPDKFILKTNHASGQNIIVTDKNKANRSKITKQIDEWLHTNHYYLAAEWQYKNIKPKVFAEELLSDEILDYRVFCFKGEPEFIWTTRLVDHVYYSSTYDKNWKNINIKWQNWYVDEEHEKPEQLDRILDIARKLSTDFDMVRVDLFNVNGKVYFSELTFTQNGGFEQNLPYEWDIKMGKMM